jgi:hypothetical protein
MKMKHVVGAVIALIVVALAIATVLIVPKRIDPGGGVIHFPFYQGTRTMDAAREMIYALGWQQKSEGGDSKQVTFRATDRNGKTVSLRFVYHIVGTKVVVTTEQNPQYSVEQITKELARRIGMHVDASPLPVAPSEAPTKRGASKGGAAVLWRAGPAWPALTDRERWVL